VSFNVHGIVYVPESSDEGDLLAQEVRTLGQWLQQVKDEQEYIKVRERVHRDSAIPSFISLTVAAESTNSRVKWWAIFQTGVLVGVCIFQVSYLKRFFEVKRVV
jgi:p24 family protein beta-1